MTRRKVIIIGLDAAIAKYTWQFMEKGTMPNLKRLADSGVRSPIIPTTPPWTPPGWATIATGAWPSTHGIEGFSVHFGGNPITEQIDGFDSRLQKAQYVWEAAGQIGKRAIVLKYPGTWPSRMDPTKGIQVGGAGGYAGQLSILDISHAQCFTTRNDVEDAIQVEVRPAIGWKNLPRVDHVLEVELPVQLAQPGQPKVYYAFMTPTVDGNGYDRLVICRSRDSDDQLVEVASDAWSDWTTDTFELAEGSRQGDFRFKLDTLSEDGHLFRLYMSQNHPIDGYTVPEEIAAELREHVGPYVEYSVPKDVWRNWIDMEAQMQIWQDQAEHLGRSAQYLMRNHDWDLFITQYHPIDSAEHVLFGGFDPKHPQYDPATAPGYWNDLSRVYAMADHLVGACMECADENTSVIVVGDHGHQPSRYVFLINNVLREAGLLYTVSDEDDAEVDWSRTKAYAYGPIHILINTKGRDPQGIIEPGEDYERVQDEIIKLLRSVKHDVTGQFVIKLACPRHEMTAQGLYGDGVGDVIYCLDDGYDVAAQERLGATRFNNIERGIPDAAGRIPVRSAVTRDRTFFRPSELGREMTSEHSSAYPQHELLQTILVMGGSGIKEGIERAVPPRLVDIAPTVAQLLGAPRPANAEGSVLADLLTNI